MAGRLEGKVAVVTGAGGGIGRASALRFAQEGARVLVADVRDSVEQTAQSIEQAGGRAIAMQVDVAEPSQVEEMISRALTDFGGLDVAFANAGIGGKLESLCDTTFEEFERVLRVNLLGAFSTVKAAAAPMVKQGQGSLIVTASVAGQRANAAGIPYSAAKAGVISLAQTIAMDLKGTGVRINAICPGLIETGMTQFVFERARARGTESRLGQLCPSDRHGLPEEIAAAALFLASDDASYVNGAALNVDGGLNAAHPFVPRKR